MEETLAVSAQEILDANLRTVDVRRQCVLFFNLFIIGYCVVVANSECLIDAWSLVDYCH